MTEPRSRFASNAEAIAFMKTVAVAQSGFTRFLAVEPLRCWEGESELLVAVRENMTQHHGFAHGAVVGMMADNACARGTHLRARGRVIKAGKRQAVVQAEVWSESPEQQPVLAAVATATIIPV
jgi:acyl-coenzyme A thioesterase PaaI-like protein